jgi:hypothetical protein
VKKNLDRSSLSLIRYFPVDKGSPGIERSEFNNFKDDNMNNSNDYEIQTKEDKDKDKFKEEGLTYPSKTHTDTGFI